VNLKLLVTQTFHSLLTSSLTTPQETLDSTIIIMTAILLLPLIGVTTASEGMAEVPAQQSITSRQSRLERVELFFILGKIVKGANKTRSRRLFKEVLLLMMMPTWTSTIEVRMEKLITIVDIQ
jgi:hypothetical protein